MQFNELERHRIWDPNDLLHDFKVPADEHVVVPGLWVVELFPPSTFNRLEQAIRRNGWDKQRRMTGIHEGNEQMLLKSRSGSGWRWWSMATIQDTKGQHFIPDGVRMKLPAEFSYLELKAVQIGSGLTAVVAHFRLSDQGRRQLDTAWHLPHEPELVRRNGRLQAEGRMWAGYRNTQTARVRPHDLAREWMRDNCPGFFAESDSPQTLIDMLLMDKHDPTGDDADHDREKSDAFRALGLTEGDIYRYTSTDIPKMTLVPSNTSMAPAMGTDRTWALWGQREAVVDSASHLDMYGSDTDRAIAHRFGDAIESFLLSLSVSDMLQTVEAQYSLIRDHARIHHGRFSAKVTNDLRKQLLTLSIDISTAQRDLKSFWRARPRFEHEAEFTIEYAPRLWSDKSDEGRRLGPIHMNTELRKRQTQWFKHLTAADRDYRDILSTVAALGASVDASSTGRRALWVALVSLVVALATVAVADIGDNSLIEHIREFLGQRL